MGWYKESFGKDYVKIYSHRNDLEAKTIVRFAMQTLDMQPGQHILDLGCGNGRNAIIAAQLGFQVCGLDLSPELLAMAQRKTRKKNLSIRFVRGDMRHIPLLGPFDAVWSLFTSFGYFSTDKENERVIREIAAVLKPGGFLLLDYLNVLQTLVNMNTRDVQEKELYQVIQERTFNQTTNRIEKTITIHENGDAREYHESVRAYHLPELSHFFQRAGLQCTAVYGDYSKKPFTQHSPRLILIGQKQ
ncbi:MAG TPA: class I SAM-dependent methyltransferase [bacterium]|nr:class I SAM-dependent methyltransferase [bacterium]HPN42606.1 class I SAM-dependent methyltransferase [bacterium]